MKKKPFFSCGIHPWVSGRRPHFSWDARGAGSRPFGAGLRCGVRLGGDPPGLGIIYNRKKFFVVVPSQGWVKGPYKVRTEVASPSPSGRGRLRCVAVAADDDGDAAAAVRGCGGGWGQAESGGAEKPLLHA